ncbi:MAG: ISL3 family transposase [Candidatus Entotheonellia bacterium]
MTQVLHTFVTTLLASTPEVHLDKVTAEQDTVRLQLTTTAPQARCPCCAVPSSSVHSRYQRHLTDLPWGVHPVRIQLTVRKFVCRNATCTRRIFTERLPDLVAPSARKTHRLITVLRAIGLALGGQAGARLAARLRLPTSPGTLLQLVRAAPMPRTPALQAVGVDEWAWWRGHRYGTILVDLATHRVVDLLPDRSAASVAAWLAKHPTITVVCRDQSDLYADGIRRGAPEAVQVVDRFHLVQNLRQALEAFLIATDRRSRTPPSAGRWRSCRRRALSLSRPCTGAGAGAPSLRSRGRRPHGRPGTPDGSPSLRPCVRSGRRGLPSPP